jgi:hypothetical protein
VLVHQRPQHRAHALAFSWEHIVDQIRDYYHEVIAQRLDASLQITPDRRGLEQWSHAIHA